MLALDEQPNLPGSIDEHPNWRRRLSVPVDELFDDDTFSDRLLAVDRARRAAPLRSAALLPTLLRSLIRHDRPALHAAPPVSRGFTFDDAAKHVDYFAALGISHLYASPITTAEPGSMHGYDTVDYTQVNAECGGEAGLKRLVDKLRAHDMGLIVDMVPNHMGVGGSSNAWWLDILEWGRHSAYARHFDVDWHSPDPALRGKVLLPYLGAPYGEELAAGSIALHFAADNGRFYIGYGPHVFPVCPIDYAAILQSAERADLSALAERFHGLTTQPTDQPRAAEARDALREFVAQNGKAGDRSRRSPRTRARSAARTRPAASAARAAALSASRGGAPRRTK